MGRFSRYTPFGLGAGELLFYGGIFYGWATLVFVLKKDGYYSDLCKNETAMETIDINDDPPTCSEQDAILNLVFTVGAFSLQGSIIFTGLIFDNLGTRFLRLILHSLIVSGLVMMALSSPSIPELIFPGMACIAIGGIAIIFTNIQIGNLFGNRRATVMTVLSGCLDSSTFVMLLIKLGYDGGISLQTSFAILAGATFFFLINTFLFLPKRHIPWPLPPDYGQKKKKEESIDNPESGSKYVKSAEETKSEEIENTKDSRQLAEGQKNKDYPTIKSCLCSPLLWLFIFWFAILQLRLLYFLDTLNHYLEQFTDGDEGLVSRYTTIFSIYQFCGIFVAPFSGMILDRNKSKQRSDTRGPYEDIRDSGLAFTATTLLYILFSISNVIPVLEVLYITFLLHIFTRGFMFALAAVGMPILFPGQYFGTLYGFLFAVSSIIGLLQFPLFIATQKFFNDDPLVINLILLGACAATIVLPIYIHFYAKRKTKELEQINASAAEKTGIDNPAVTAEA